MPESKKPKIKKAAWGSVGPAKMVSLRMPVELIEKLNAASKQRGISKNQIIVAACLREVEEESGSTGKGES